jgi:hypothetical protein
VFLGDGAGNFGTRADFSTGFHPQDVVICDLNTDGVPDIAVANVAANTASALVGVGDGTLGTTYSFATAIVPIGIAVGDYDRDGRPDLAVACQAPDKVSILINNLVCGLAAVAESPTLTSLRLSASPNPSSGQTSILFSLPASGPASIEIYDVLGRRLRQWEWPSMVSGQHHVEWNGVADDGHSVPPSVLFYRLRAGGQVLEQKIVRMQ